ncbi:hypothetical protein DM01DRAFT_1406491 [Hesseltinella vesiculosa]|uniref:Uncharacterized protein n=1 Tax=Hesseltinella vesiculosa TaxID=101127 RepID=A0A1X2GMJ5_9FUNG|nr:hypothetical protein DM01DRAFT_1406491 [Hesseltinella vesiculosa]
MGFSKRVVTPLCRCTQLVRSQTMSERKSLQPTSHLNNLQEHFGDRLRQFVNLMPNLKNQRALLLVQSIDVMNRRPDTVGYLTRWCDKISTVKNVIPSSFPYLSRLPSNDHRSSSEFVFPHWQSCTSSWRIRRGGRSKLQLLPSWPKHLNPQTLMN